MVMTLYRHVNVFTPAMDGDEAKTQITHEREANLFGRQVFSHVMIF